MSGLKVHDVAARLNVSEKTVYKWLRQGLIPATRIGKTWIITEESIDAMLYPSVTSVGGPHFIYDSEERPTYGDDSTRETGNRRAQNNKGLAETGTRREKLESSLHQFNRTLSGAVKHGIDGIHGPRRLDPDTPAAIASSLEQADGEVLLQGIGLREFFGDSDYTALLRKMAAEDRQVRVRALLVNPAGQFARARSVAEDGEQFADDSRFRAGPLFGDSWRSLNVIASLRRAGNESQRFSLDVRFIDHWPSVYLVLNSNAAFVETYHFGKQDPNIDGSTIEGLVPMLQLSPDSSYFNLLRNHFDYLWTGKNQFVPSLTLEQVADEMQVKL